MRRSPLVLAVPILSGHVSKGGPDLIGSSHARPSRKIGTVTPDPDRGSVREWVKPIYGGTDDGRRITYRAPIRIGEEILIKGSERITSWTHQAGGVWKAELPNSFFGEYNPYALTVSGGWLNYGQSRSRSGSRRRLSQWRGLLREKDSTGVDKGRAHLVLPGG